MIETAGIGPDFGMSSLKMGVVKDRVDAPVWGNLCQQITADGRFFQIGLLVQVEVPPDASFLLPGSHEN